MLLPLLWDYNILHNKSFRKVSKKKMKQESQTNSRFNMTANGTLAEREENFHRYTVYDIAFNPAVITK